MKFIQGQNRTQLHLFPISLDQSIDHDNEVRIIDLFVDSLKLSTYGFDMQFIDNGRPAYHPADLLKLYIYGYMNRIRSSRGLEKECKRNIEVMWLLNCLQPDHNTISNFRRDNSKAIKKVFRETVKLASNFDLIGGKLLAGDSTKLRAQNSKKNNYNEKKIARHIAYIDAKLEEYNEALSSDDEQNKETVIKEIEKHKNRKQQYQEYDKQIKETGEVQLSTSDPESRQMITRNNITEVAYNIQTTVDAKHNIPIDYKVTSTNDSKAMGNMLQRAKSILKTNEFTVLYDKGYHTGSELAIAENLGVTAIVAIPGVPSSSQSPDPAYNFEHFIYNTDEDNYTCPQGELLYTTGTWHKGTHFRFKQYRSKACNKCAYLRLCTSSKRNGRIIQRSEYTQAIEKNKERIESSKSLYRRRQSIVEHPYGTIKRQWGFDHVMTKKTKQRASGDLGLILIAYNLKRIINILGSDLFKAYMSLFLAFFMNLYNQNRLKITDFKDKTKTNQKFVEVNIFFAQICYI